MKQEHTFLIDERIVHKARRRYAGELDSMVEQFLDFYIYYDYNEKNKQRFIQECRGY